MGQAAFIGLGAYTVAIMRARWGTPFLLNILRRRGGHAGRHCGGIPSLRVSLYLAIATIAASFIAHFLFANFDFTGGTGGLTCLWPALFGLPLDTSFRLYWLIVPVTLLMLLGAGQPVSHAHWPGLHRHPRPRHLGRGAGIALLRHALLSFGLSSLRRVAGGLWAYFFRVVTPESSR